MLEAVNKPEDIALVLVQPTTETRPQIKTIWHVVQNSRSHIRIFNIGFLEQELPFSLSCAYKTKKPPAMKQAAFRISAVIATRQQCRENAKEIIKRRAHSKHSFLRALYNGFFAKSIENPRINQTLTIVLVARLSWSGVRQVTAQNCSCMPSLHQNRL